MSVHVRVPAVVEPPQKGGSNLAPQHKSKTLVISGFHRTKHEDAVAGIAFDGIVIGRGRVYGPGFYMTRTFAGQNNGQMLHYGPHIVRCEVEATRFICFDRAMARRLWGKDHTLKDQLFGSPVEWTPSQKIHIEEWSKVLDVVWARKVAKEKSNRKRSIRYNAPAGQLDPDDYLTSSDVAVEAWKRLNLDKNCPGIMYTGRNDGMCCVVYDLKQVKPLATLYAPKILVGDVKSLPWDDLTCPDLRRRLRPESFLAEDVAKYTVSLDVLQHALCKTPDVFAVRCFKGYRSAKKFYDKSLWLHAISKKSLTNRIPKAFRDFVYNDVAKTFIKEYEICLPHLHASIFTPHYYVCAPTGNKTSTPEGTKVRFMKEFAGLCASKGFQEAYTDILIQESLKRQRVAYAKLHKRLRLLKSARSLERTALRIFAPFKERIHIPASMNKSQPRKKVPYHQGNMPTVARMADSVEVLVQYTQHKRDSRGNWQFRSQDKMRFYMTKPLLARWEKELRTVLVDFHETLCHDPLVIHKPGIKAMLDTWWDEKGHDYVWSTFNV